MKFNLTWLLDPLFVFAFTKSSLTGSLVASLKVKLSFPVSVLEASRLVKLGRLSGKDLDLSSWWSSLVEKLAVSEIMYLVAYIATDAKR